ncbi:hypothetical protein NL108_003510 [Boleophthalmus pectinirostris]|nr:hypothetical protein NL108_003510 [Boleophthalmus pectinirostris]
MEDQPSPCTSGSNNGSRSIQIILQSPTESQEITVKEDSNVRQLKAGLAEDRGAQVDGVMLIHAGRVLGDSELLGSLQGKDGAVKLTVSQRRYAETSSVSTDEDVSSPTAALLDPEGEAQTPTSPLFLVEALDSLGLSHTGPGLFPLLQAQMERQLLSSPETMHRVLGSAFVQGSLSGAGPELVHALILSNPQTQQLLQTSPELEKEISDPQVMAQVLELVRNPEMIKKILKSEETTEAGPCRQRQRPQRAKPTKQHFNFPPKTSFTKPDRGVQPPEPCTDGLSKLTTTSKADISAGLQSLLEQVSSSGLMESLLSGPHVKNLLQCLSHNPDLAAQMLLSHPLLSENPHLQQQLRQQLPVLLQQMQSPELLSAMLNPKAVEALVQIQQGLQTLASEAPALIPVAGFGNNSTFEPESVFNNKPRNGPAVSTATEHQQQFVQQMLQALANSDHKDLDQLSS